MVGGIFLLIGLWPFIWRQEAIRVWVVVPGALLAVAGLMMPGLLKQVYQGWMWVGHVMGWVNTRIILGILFYGIVTPMGLVMKLTGRDPMRRAFEPDAIASPSTPGCSAMRAIRSASANTIFGWASFRP